MTFAQEAMAGHVSRRAVMYVDAARHVQTSQLLGRSRRLIAPRLLAAGLGRSSPTDYLRVAAGLGAPVATQSGPQPQPTDTGLFAAYGHARSAGDQGLWQPGPEGLLYLFHLHSFTSLAQYAAGPSHTSGDRFWARMVENWLELHPTPTLPGWHPYPTSLRIVSWCSALGALNHWPEAWCRRVAGEIYRQARYLRRTVEHDIGGNHVLANAKALVFAGATLTSARLMDAGLSLLNRELRRQILADGGHEERSTAYHREIAGDLAAVSRLLTGAGRSVPDWLLHARRTMDAWLSALTGPDGTVPMLNDAWAGPGGPDRPVAPVTALTASGYVALRADHDQAIVDCGRLCPPHLPPHAHADVLSVVLWMDGRPLLVDPGSCAYTGPDRALFRATAAHNTVTVDGQDQCVFWGDFRAGLLPRVTGPTMRRQDGVIVVEGSHDGYRRLADPAVHHRATVWVPGAGLVVIDRLRCRQRHRAGSSLTLAPGVRYADSLASGVRIVPLGQLGAARAELGRYAPYLGVSEATTRLVSAGDVRGGEPFGWSVLRPDTSAQLADDGALEISREPGLPPARIHLQPL